MSGNGLSTLDAALDARKMAEAFLAPLRACSDQIEVRKVDIEILSQRSKRCVIRYIVEAEDPNRQHRRFSWRAIGKVYRENEGEEVFETMRKLWHGGFERDAADRISIPEPLAFLSAFRMLLQLEIPGLSVSALIKKSPDLDHARRLARTIAKFHKCPLVPDRRKLVKEHLLRCHPPYSTFADSCPELKDEVSYIVESALAIEASLTDLRLTPIHGDFHLGQVHLQDGHAWLFDFDGVGLGDPAADVGNVLVFLKDKVRSVPNVMQLVEVFLDEYFSQMDAEIAERIPLYEGLTHLRRACKCLRLKKEGWRARAQSMITKGVSSIERAGARGPYNLYH